MDEDFAVRRAVGVAVRCCLDVPPIRARYEACRRRTWRCSRGRRPHQGCKGIGHRGPLTQFADGSFTSALTHAATCTVALIGPDQTPRHLTMDTLAELRNSAV
ncbi:hypothetical protein [Streptomyces sp. NPDC059744]|uniref:hypothetical protein n=1 Tax=Streptomyces sp. NPDC059744 TaxID=3346929 RepID=UPI003667460B